MLPFTREAFFGVFARYNDALWPAPVLLAGVAAACVLLVFLGRGGGRIVGVTLSGLWAWMAVAYHFAFFSSINGAAWGFGGAFLVASALFAWSTWRRTLVFDRPHGASAAMAAIVLFYALVGYPAIGFLLGHRFPAAPTFGLPCPTTIFTFGMLLLARRPVPRALFVVPFAWAAIGSVAAFRLGVLQDLGLLASAIVTAMVLLVRNRPMRHRAHAHA